MSSTSKWVVLVLSVLSLAIVACGDGDKPGNDGGHGGSAGNDGTAGTGGTDEGTAGTGGTDEGTAGTGGTDEGTAGTGGGGEISAACQASCDRTYECGFSYNSMKREDCYQACEEEFLDEWKECLPTASCDEIGPCTWTCERAAEETCTEQPSSTCWPVYFDHVGCMVENDCVTERGVIDYKCMDAACSDTFTTYRSCIENDCQEFLACQG